MNNNILITSAGRRVSLVKAFQNELKKVFPDAIVITTDLNPNLSSASQVSDKSVEICEITDSNYISELISICKLNNVGVIIPTIDTELQILAENKEKFENTNVIVSSKMFISICRDKRNTNNFFIENGINIPRQFNITNFEFPLFIKPNNGSLSADIHVIENNAQLNPKLLNEDKYMFMEYLSPNEYQEYTIDLYYDRNSDLKCIVPRKRIEVRGGEISKGKTIKNEIVNLVKQKLVHIEGAIGCLTLQVFLNTINNIIIGIEINPRFGGGYPLSYFAGANYPKFIIEEYFLNKNLDYFEDWKENTLMLRYDSEVIIYE